MRTRSDVTSDRNCTTTCCSSSRLALSAPGAWAHPQSRVQTLGKSAGGLQ